MTVIDFGIVFDIDGVVYRGGELLPGARETIEQVTSTSIPYLFLTNNGMETEAKRAERLGKQLDLHLPSNRLVLCHSALREEAAEMRDGLILVTGYCLMDSIELMQSLGFKNVQTVDNYAACHPTLYPLKHYPKVADREWADAPVEMIVVLETSLNWAQDIQIICDLMMHHGYVSPKLGNETRRQPKLVGCNSDFTYVGAHDTPRLGPGAFVEALCLTYKHLTKGEELDFVKHGKPHAPMYRLAEQRLQQQMHQQSSRPHLRLSCRLEEPRVTGHV